MAINFVDISLDDDTSLSEYESLNTYLLAGWTVIGNSTYTITPRYGEMNEFVGEPKSWERFTLFKPDHTIGENSTDNGKRALELADSEGEQSTPEFEEVSIEVYWTESHAIEVRAPNLFSGLLSDLQARTKFVVTYGGGDPITAFDNIKDAIVYVDKREQSSTPQAATVPTEYSISAATEEAMGWQETSRRATVPTGDEYYLDSDNGYWHLRKGEQGSLLAIFDTDKQVEAEICTRIARTETHALREQNAKLQAEIAEYKASLSRQAANSLQVERELEAARVRLGELESKVEELRDTIIEWRDVVDNAHTMAIDIVDTDHHQDGRLHNVSMLRDFLESHLKIVDSE